MTIEKQIIKVFEAALKQIAKYSNDLTLEKKVAMQALADVEKLRSEAPEPPTVYRCHNPSGPDTAAKGTWHVDGPNMVTLKLKDRTLARLMVNALNIAYNLGRERAAGLVDSVWQSFTVRPDQRLHITMRGLQTEMESLAKRIRAGE